MQAQMKQIIDRCKEVFALAEKMYQVDMSKVGIRFDLKGRAAGMACVRGTIFDRVFYIRFNRDMLGRDAFEHLLNATVPHEIAHIVCFMEPKLGKDHDRGWANVCKALGGSGERYHKEEVVYGKGATYEYTTTTGHKVRASQQVHNRIQRGGEYRYRGKGVVNQFCAHSVVGYSGRTLAEPVVKKAVNHPAVIEAALREPMPDAAEMARRAAMVEALRKAQQVPKPAASFNHGESKASIARAIMLSGYKGGESYESIITAIMAATGHERQLARAYFKNNIVRLNIPASFIV